MGCLRSKPKPIAFLHYEKHGYINTRHDCHVQRVGRRTKIITSTGNVLFEGYIRVKDSLYIPHGRRGTMFMYDMHMPGRSYALHARWHNGIPIGLCSEVFLINNKPKASYMRSADGKCMTGRCLHYYASGFLESDQYFDMNGQQIGPFTTYYPNGHKQSEGQYNARGELHGELRAYDLAGRCVETTTYHHGRQV